MVNAIKVSNVLLRKAKSSGIKDVTNLKLQKLLYLLYERYARETNEKLFNESVIAWRHGPIVREVYDKYKVNGSKVIDKFDETEKVEKSLEEMIDEVLEDYGHISAWKLVEITHKKGGPWDKTIKSNKQTIEFELLVN